MNTEPPPANQSPAPAVRLLALGDSYTIGESVAASERWPEQLAELLRKEGPPVERPTVIAQTGWTSGELLACSRRRAGGELTANAAPPAESHDCIT